MNDAGGGDDLVGRIAAEIERNGRLTDVEAERPDMDTRKRPDKRHVLQVDLDAPQLREFGDLPQDDRRNAPAIALQEGRLAGAQTIAESVQQNMGVEIEYPTRSRWRGCLP